VRIECGLPKTRAAEVLLSHSCINPSKFIDVWTIEVIFGVKKVLYPPREMGGRL
jgi:hypothetical protein